MWVCVTQDLCTGTKTTTCGFCWVLCRVGFVAIEILSAVQVVCDTSPMNYRSEPEQKLMCGWDEQIQWQRVQIYGEIKLHGLSIAVVLRAKVGQEICHKGKLEFSPSCAIIWQWGTDLCILTALCERSGFDSSGSTGLWCQNRQFLHSCLKAKYMGMISYSLQLHAGSDLCVS